MLPRSRHYLLRVARFLLVCVVFSHAALAGSGCLMANADLTKVLEAEEAPACGGMGSMSLNLCLAHCTADSQSLDVDVPAVLVPPAVLVLVVPLLPDVVPTTSSRDGDAVATGDPPIPIRFCSFLI
jgi:hypothetical protein